MPRRQTSIPRRWLIVADASDARLRTRLKRLPRGTGILLIDAIADPRDSVAVKRLARLFHLPVSEERSGDAARVHDVRELRQARLARTRLILISPIFPTRSHPDRRSLPRMRAAALARLAGGRAIALGGMNDRRFRRIARLGFVGWAGIDAWGAR